MMDYSAFSVFRPDESKESHKIWVNGTERIASFHEVEGYSAQTFSNYELFMSYVNSLQKRSYRFQ